MCLGLYITVGIQWLDCGSMWIALFWRMEKANVLGHI